MFDEDSGLQKGSSPLPQKHEIRQLFNPQETSFKMLTEEQADEVCLVGKSGRGTGGSGILAFSLSSEELFEDDFFFLPPFFFLGPIFVAYPH